jgi:hypothetical protein
MPKVAGINAHCRETLASHMPVLLAYLAEFAPTDVVEFGSGMYSTGALLASSAEQVLTIEIASAVWLARVRQAFGERAGWTALHRTKTQMDDIHGMLTQRYRALAFADDGGTRAPLANFCMATGCVNTVIVHDTQQPWRKHFVVPDGWQRVDFKRFPVVYKHNRRMNPWTTLFTHDTRVYAYFAQPGLEDTLYKRYRFPYEQWLYKRKEQ